MKTLRFPVILLAVGLLIMRSAPLLAQSDDEGIKMVRGLIKADRQETVARTLQLTEAESPGFWPLYHQYRAEMDKVADSLLKLVQEYAGYYPDVSKERARTMLKELTDLQKRQVATRAHYLKKFGKVLSAEKNLRFAQVENRLDLAVQLKLASEIPLVPVEGHLRGEVTGAAVVAPGEAGGAVVQTYELTATVTSIDKADRKVTLLSPDGITQTVKVGSGAINFDQIRVGDQLKVVATEELVVYVAGEGEPSTNGEAALVALAPKGAKPGGIMADTAQVTARVTAIDAEHHKATLRFEDGATRTVAVRRDVDLSKRKVGDKVVIRTTEMIAISVGKL